MKTHKKLFLTCLALVCIAMFLALGAIVYGPVLSFRLGYEMTPFKETYLASYSPKNRDVGAGYVPADVDQFLCDRIESTEDEREFAAITNFYSQQAGGREGVCIYKTSEQTREKMIDHLMGNLDAHDYRSQIILVEELRLGKSLGKGKIGLGAGVPTPADWRAWETEALPIARAAYLEWWNSNSSWDEKKRTDPLGNSTVHVNECCG